MARSEFPRDILNRLTWSPDSDLSEAEIIILHRGAPEDRKTIFGHEIRSLGHMFFETSVSTIPYHRILEIWHRGEKIFEKPKKNIE